MTCHAQDAAKSVIDLVRMTDKLGLSTRKAQSPKPKH